MPYSKPAYGFEKITRLDGLYNELRSGEIFEIQTTLIVVHDEYRVMTR